MPVRLKWEFDGTKLDYKAKAKGANYRNQIIDLIDNEQLTVWFQPIFCLNGLKHVYGFEALTRLKQDAGFANIHDLFQVARVNGILTNLDITCLSNAVREAASKGIKDRESYVFINITPETLCDSSYCITITSEIVGSAGLDRNRVVFEITEEGMVSNFERFKKIIAVYKEAGYKVAIDDFGAGYGGLKMLSIIEPDFVKIDRHFISNIDKAIINYNLVDSITIACHRMGIKLVAEGIEREEELNIVASMGIDLCQGFYLCRPQPSLDCNIEVLKEYKKRSEDSITLRSQGAEIKFIGDIVKQVPTLDPQVPVKDVINSLLDISDLNCMPVVSNDRIMGVIYRSRFIENQVVGKCGYGMHLNYHKKVSQVMERTFLVVEANESLEAVSEKVQKRNAAQLYDELIVTKHGKYHGIVPINILLDAITQKSIALAKNANPLTGLPGNEAIQREIEKRIIQNIHFDVAYFDLNNFKPFNDYYGFERGDFVILTLSEIIKQEAESTQKDGTFVGHIGGDDFIMIIHPTISIQTCSNIIARFEQKLVDFHSKEDYVRGYYTSKNRKGEIETFNLLSVAIGIVSTEVYKVNSFAELASIASEVKKAAKTLSQREGRSAIFRDRRLQG